MTFKLREGGFLMELGLKDININLFKQMGLDPKSFKKILYKINNKDNPF